MSETTNYREEDEQLDEEIYGDEYDYDEWVNKGREEEPHFIFHEMDAFIFNKLCGFK